MSTPAWVVKSVQPKTDYTLLLTFADGKKGVYNARELLKYPIYSALKNINFFLKARVDGDSVIWNDEIDIAPELLYEQTEQINDK